MPTAPAIEAHFSFFVILIVVALYEDWRPFLVAVAFVTVHHAAMGVIDYASVDDHPGSPWQLAAIHGAFMLAASIAAVVSWRMNEDIRSDSERAGERERASDARFRSAFDDGPVSMALISYHGPSRGTLAGVNRTLCETFGYAESELSGAHLSTLFGAGGEERLLRAIKALKRGGDDVACGDLTMRDCAGRTIDARLSMSLVAGGDGDLIVQIEDVTDRNRLQRELQDLADLDPLTGLLSRRRFGRELTGELDRAQREGRGGAVVLIDLDNFKAVNDNHSHLVGDEILLAAAHAISDHTRGSGLVARLDGDEFAVLLPTVGRARAAASGHALVRRIAERAVLGEGARTQRTTASVGVVVYASDAQLTGDQLLNDADLAMYEAKDDGGDRCVVYSADGALASGLRDRARRLRRRVRLVSLPQGRSPSSSRTPRRCSSYATPASTARRATSSASPRRCRRSS